MKMFSLLILFFGVYSSKGDVIINCKNEMTKCTCKQKGKNRIVLYEYPPFLGKPKKAKNLDNFAVKNLKLLSSSKVLDCYNFKNCLPILKNRLQVELVQDKDKLIDKIKDEKTDLVYPIPIDVHNNITMMTSDGR